MDVRYLKESTMSIPDDQLSPKQLVEELRRIANSIDKTDRPSKLRVASLLRRLQTRMCPVRRMATPTTIEVDVTDGTEYDRIMNSLGDG